MAGLCLRRFLACEANSLLLLPAIVAASALGRRSANDDRLSTTDVPPISATTIGTTSSDGFAKLDREVRRGLQRQARRGLDRLARNLDVRVRPPQHSPRRARNRTHGRRRLLLHLPAANRQVDQSPSDRKAVAEAGSFFLIDPRAPLTGHLETQGSVVTIRVARDELEARTGPTGALVARTLSADNPVAALAFGFVACCPTASTRSTKPPRRRSSSRPWISWRSPSRPKASAASHSRPARGGAHNAEGRNKSRLHDPNLKPVTAAAAAGISVRYANALLAQEQTGLEAYIIGRRLERCRRALDDPAQARRTIGDIAFSWGFSDLSHFGRRFKAEFGCAPGEYRKQRSA